MRIVKLDDDMQAFLADLAWPPGVPTPTVDVLISDAGASLRLVHPDRTDIGAAADTKPPGASHVSIISAIATLAELWTARHGGEPGSWPDGIRAQVVRKLDMRTAAAWVYRVQVASALSLAADAG